MSDGHSPDEIVERYRQRRRGVLRRRRNQLILAVIAVLGVLLVAAAVIRVLPAAAQLHEVSGTVHCASGSAVQGVWVKEGRGSGGGFAGWSPEPGDRSKAHYHHGIWSGSYAVHVGCGGTKDAWGIEVRSGFVSGHSNDFICYDQEKGADSPKCVVEK